MVDAIQIFADQVMGDHMPKDNPAPLPDMLGNRRDGNSTLFAFVARLIP